MRLIDADALIEFCAERWIPLNIDAVNMQPTIQPVATETNDGDIISRQEAINMVRDVCDAIMSCCDSYYDSETGDEVYKDILEVDAILKCNKEIRIALRNMPSVQSEQSTDIQDVLQYLDNVLHPLVSPENWNVYSELYDMISNLPSAQPEPSKITEEQAILYLQSTGWMQNHDREMYESGLRERKTGRWIRGSYTDDDKRYNDYSYKCSECGNVVDYKKNFCPNCGADMRGEQDEID